MKHETYDDVAFLCFIFHALMIHITKFGPPSQVFTLCQKVKRAWWIISSTVIARSPQATKQSLYVFGLSTANRDCRVTLRSGSGLLAMTRGTRERKGLHVRVTAHWGDILPSVIPAQAGIQRFFSMVLYSGFPILRVGNDSSQRCPVSITINGLLTPVLAMV